MLALPKPLYIASLRESSTARSTPAQLADLMARLERKVARLDLRGAGAVRCAPMRWFRLSSASLRRKAATASKSSLQSSTTQRMSACRSSCANVCRINSAVSGLRFFFTFACDRPELGQYLRIVKQPQKLPIVLTQEEAGRLMEAAPGPKFRAVFGIAYGAGLRVSEVAHLKLSDNYPTIPLSHYPTIPLSRIRADRHIRLPIVAPSNSRMASLS